MTALGLIYLCSAIYLMGIICLAISLNDNDTPRRIVRETLRRWLKFLGWSVLLAVIVWIIG